MMLLSLINITLLCTAVRSSWFQSRQAREVNAMVFGAASVGKSCIVQWLLSSSFQPRMITTIGADNFPMHVTVGDEHVSFRLWDTAGQERFAPLSAIYHRLADVAVIVYSVNSVETMNRAQRYVQSILEQSPSASLIMVGSQADLDDLMLGEKYLSELAYEFCQLYGIPHMLVSALDGTNMEELRRWVAEAALRRQKHLEEEAEIARNDRRVRLEVDEAYMVDKSDEPAKMLDDSCCDST